MLGDGDSNVIEPEGSQPVGSVTVQGEKTEVKEQFESVKEAGEMLGDGDSNVIEPEGSKAVELVTVQGEKTEVQTKNKELLL